MQIGGDKIDSINHDMGAKQMASDPPSKKKWDKENTVLIAIKFQKKTDQDCIDFLEGKNKRDTICAALREYMKNYKGD